MSRAAFMVLFLLTIPHVAEARAAGRGTATRPVPICENHTRPIDPLHPRDCIERPKPQKRSVRINTGAATARTYHTSGNGSITVIGPDVVAHHSAIATASTKSSWAPAGVVGRPPRVGHLAFRVGKRSRDLQLASVQTRA